VPVPLTFVRGAGIFSPGLPRVLTQLGLTRKLKPNNLILCAIVRDCDKLCAIARQLALAMRYH